MQLVLIKHSKTSIEADKPIPLWFLSSEGIKLAEKLSATDVIRSLDVIYSSLQTKALETAVILAKPNYIPLEVNSGLGEITSFTRKYLEEPLYSKAVKDFYNGKTKRIAGGETGEEALNRFWHALEVIVKREKNLSRTRVGIVSHGNILSYFASQFLDKEAKELHDKIAMPDYAIFDWQKKQFLNVFGWKG